jgi:hypothetical protein
MSQIVQPAWGDLFTGGITIYKDYLYVVMMYKMTYKESLYNMITTVFVLLQGLHDHCRELPCQVQSKPRADALANMEKAACF